MSEMMRRSMYVCEHPLDYVASQLSLLCRALFVGVVGYSTYDFLPLFLLS